MKPFQTEKILFCIGLVIVVVKLWLVQAHPLMATSTPHDDLLFVSQANSILNGEWLGDLSQLTLIKGSFYPIFIAISYYLGIPLLLSQQLLYILACLVTVWAVAPLVPKRPFLLFIIFVVLVLNPYSYNYPAVGRVLRLGIYAPLGLLVFATVLGMVIRSQGSIRGMIGWSLGAGVCLAAFWNTREESIWIAPSLVIMYLPLIWRLRRHSLSEASGRVLVYMLPFAILAAVNAALVHKNASAYGVPARIEVETPEFKSAYGGLLRIRTDDWMQYYPAVRSARAQAYQVSPTFREVRPFLDGPLGQRWMDLCGCPDLPAGFFIWAFRDSVAAAGYYKDGPSALDFYRRMGEEIDQACDNGTLDCRPRYTSLIPPWHREYNRLLLPEYISVLWQIISFRNFSAATDGYLSNGKTGAMRIYEIVTGEQLLTSKRQVLESDPPYHAHFDKEKIRILADIGSAYKVLVPIFFCLAAIVFVFSVIRGFWKKSLSIFTVAAGASLAGILAIAFILTLLKITSYTEIGRALHSAYPMVLVFIVMMIAELAALPGFGNHGWSSVGPDQPDSRP